MGAWVRGCVCAWVRVCVGAWVRTHLHKTAGSNYFFYMKTVTDLWFLSDSPTNVRWLVICHCYDCAVYIKAHRVSRSMECATGVK